MKITISKILNKTDLAESGSHGGLVVTKPMINPLTDFFEETGVDRDFKDKDDGEIFSIHYMDYTSNGTTPNDRVTPIGRFKTKHELKPGDQLILQKIDQNGQKDYFIEYARRLNAAYFVGKSKESVEVLDFEQFTNVIIRKIQEGKVQSITSNDCEMYVRYMGVLGKLTISQTTDGFEMYFDGVHIEEKYKYFELDMSVEPFELRKTDSWRLDIELDVNEADTELNDEADQSLIRDIGDENLSMDKTTYIPVPEDKKPENNVNGRKIPNRSRDKAKKALNRADFKCEVDESHKLFLRKSQPINYTEPHHLIPLKYDKLFSKSLDVEANIVSLCSYCHNLIHYGADAEIVIRKLWEDRKEELEAAVILEMNNGTRLTVDILLGLYGIK